eukprot:10646825-Lingulodinium_polyedra.AAC.1
MSRSARAGCGGAPWPCSGATPAPRARGSRLRRPAPPARGRRRGRTWPRCARARHPPGWGCRGRRTPSSTPPLPA